MNEQPDHALITQALHGDSTAFGDLVRRYQHDVFNVCLRLVGNRQDAEDMTQETFIRAHRKLHTFSSEYSFGPWIRKVAANLCLNELKKHYRKTEQIAAEDLEWRYPASMQGPAAIVEEHVQARRIRQAIRSLPPNYRMVIELRHYQGLSYKEIAGTMNISIDNVKSHLFRARKKLAGKLENEI